MNYLNFTTMLMNKDFTPVTFGFLMVNYESYRFSSSQEYDSYTGLRNIYYVLKDNLSPDAFEKNLPEKIVVSFKLSSRKGAVLLTIAFLLNHIDCYCYHSMKKSSAGYIMYFENVDPFTSEFPKMIKVRVSESSAKRIRSYFF